MKSLSSIIIFFALLNPAAHAFGEGILVSPEETLWIGEKIFNNECGGKNECLLDWNDGEDFLSLGIGHFIWYPAGKPGPFEESFPKFIAYLKTIKCPVPGWLDTRPFPKCPWNSKKDFLLARTGAKAAELQSFLMATKKEQSAFLVQGLESALPLMLQSAPPEKQQGLREQFYRLAATSEGIFAVIDYINFKGLGTGTGEHYSHKGWGLLQALSQMQGREEGRKALEEFVQVAKMLLAERVKNAPPERNEQRWLAGWHNRIESYLKE